MKIQFGYLGGLLKYDILCILLHFIANNIYAFIYKTLQAKHPVLLDRTRLRAPLKYEDRYIGNSIWRLIFHNGEF